MLMIGNLADWRESTAFADKRNGVISEDLIHAQRIGTHDRRVRDHHWLMAVADVVGKESPLAIVDRSNHEHLLLALDDADDEPLIRKDEAIILLKDGTARQGRGEFESTVRPPSCARAQTLFPAQGHEIVLEAERVTGERVESIGLPRNRD
jgi:hypothetical protein